MGNNVNVTATLLNSYFNTAWIKTYGTNPVLNSMVQRKSWKMGMHYVEELVGNFAQGGPNLAVADCGRGREAGFQSYKHIRAALFPKEAPISSYADISTDPDTQAQFDRCPLKIRK